MLYSSELKPRHLTRYPSESHEAVAPTRTKQRRSSRVIIVIKAFKQNSIDYLLKPIQLEELRIALDKYQRLHQTAPQIDLQALSNLLQQQNKSYRQRIMVKVGDHLRSISMEDVTHIYSAQKITFLHVKSGRAYPIDPSVDKIMEELDPDTFYRISRSHLAAVQTSRNRNSSPAG